MMPGTTLERAPDLMTPEERFAEVARILARGYMRLAQKRREKALALSAGEPLLSTAEDAPSQEGDTCRTS